MTTTAATEQKAPPLRVTYLLGTGATQGSVSFRGSTVRLVMDALATPLLDGMRELMYSKAEFKTHAGLQRLVNDIEDDTDFEQLITFLEDAPSATHQRFATGLKQVFSTVLRTRLAQVESELGDSRSDLFAALIDMHNVPDAGEELVGFLTLNYDNILEHAIEKHAGRPVNYGIAVSSEAGTERAIRVLKLHGSYSWSDEWPVRLGDAHPYELWIPPGIRKAKSSYPFNLIWGFAHELLDCDVLRIIGCNLGPNDWDLVSMLFTTMHAHASQGPYRIEVIARPQTADRIADLFPYLSVVSILELPELGPDIVREHLPGAPTEFTELTKAQRKLVMDQAQVKIPNAFEYWLRIKGEAMNRELDSLSTKVGLFERFVLGEDD